MSDSIRVLAKDLEAERRELKVALTVATERIAALEAENARLKAALGDDLSTCSAPGCGAWYCADNTDWHHAERTQDAAAGWVQAVGEFPAREYCSAHAGMAVSG